LLIAISTSAPPTALKTPGSGAPRLSGTGRIRAGGIERDVAFATATAETYPEIDAAYHPKYDQYGPQIVGTVVGPCAAAGTLRLVPQD
jgi:hypothetical protein